MTIATTPRFLCLLAPLAVSVAWIATAALPARAEQLLFQRGDSLFAADLDGSDAHRLFTIGGPQGIVWASAPDGRRVAWMVRPPAATSEASGVTPVPTPSPAGGQIEGAGAGTAAPVTVYLSDLTGVHQKRLFSTDNLRDRRGRKIVSVGGDLPGDVGGGAAANGARRLSLWYPTSLAWSADSRTLYVCCRLLSDTMPLRQTFAVDAATGIALVDADGRWKPVAPATDVDARGVVLVGAGTAVYPPSPASSVTAAPPAASSVTSAEPPATPTPSPIPEQGGGMPPAAPPASPAQAAVRYSPLVLINLAEGTHTTLYQPREPVTLPLPDYAFAQDPALSGNDHRYIAFTSANKGLWLLDRTMSAYRELLERNVFHPRWTVNANALYFLEPRPLPDGRTQFDLYDATFAVHTGELAIPEVVLQNVDGFDIVPE